MTDLPRGTQPPMIDGEPGPARRRLHRAISVVLEPSLAATPFILAFVYFRRASLTLGLGTMYAILFLFGAVIPGLFTLFLLKTGRIESVFYSRRRDRMYFYPLMFFCEIGVFLLFATTTTSLALPAAAFSSMIVTLGLAALTRYNKISYHVAGLGGALSVAVNLIGYGGFVFLPMMVLVAYSRTRLRAHTWLEVGIGGLYGIVASAAGFRWFMVHGRDVLAHLPVIAP